MPTAESVSFVRQRPTDRERILQMNNKAHREYRGCADTAALVPFSALGRRYLTFAARSKVLHRSDRSSREMKHFVCASLVCNPRRMLVNPPRFGHFGRFKEKKKLKLFNLQHFLFVCENPQQTDGAIVVTEHKD
ncbi:hypothetical protein L596_002275 [Steinernema carpocapsae]|uniref:Uncharacterized protein n=1 Tax=Steinernema carpocapsae TaxID=34508 RepID=A0A4U8UQN7_STECR|nr:hypothetical protein L596_002275 [Steinernema carpocapsae]